MYSDVASFATHIKPVLQQIRLLTGLNVGGKTRNIAIKHPRNIKPVLQQIRLLTGLNVGGKTRNIAILIVAKQVARFLLPVNFSVPLAK